MIVYLFNHRLKVNTVPFRVNLKFWSRDIELEWHYNRACKCYRFGSASCNTFVAFRPLICHLLLNDLLYLPIHLWNAWMNLLSGFSYSRPGSRGRTDQETDQTGFGWQSWLRFWLWTGHDWIDIGRCAWKHPTWRRRFVWHYRDHT